MQWLFDHSGKRYLDLLSGIVTVSVGHCHPKVNKALKDQVDKLWHTTNIYMHPKIHEYAKKLAAKLPGKLKVAYFTNSGTEANELAVMMARMHTGNFDIISLRNAYHGAGPFVMNMTALGTWKYPVASNSGFLQTINPDVYRGPWGGANCRDSAAQTQRNCDCAPGQCKASEQYVDQLKDTLAHSTPKKGVAAFIAEPIQGVGGSVQIPRGYLKAAYETIRESGGVCISDEVQTGFGRLGSHYWAFEANEVEPDIVTLAKGIGNGFPLAAVVTTPEIAHTMTQALHFNTFGGNPMACAVGLAVLDAIDEDGLQENSGRVGDVMLNGMLSLREEFEMVGDVRGKGLMLGMELVKSKATKDPLPVQEMNAIWESCRESGILLGKGGLYGSVFRIKPPMCITEDDAHFALEVIRNALKNHS